MIRRPMVWTQQPPICTPVNLSGIAKGADVIHRSPWEPNLVDRVPLVTVGSPIQRITPAGLGASFNATYTNRFTCNWPGLANGQEYTYALVIVADNLSATNTIICSDNVAGGGVRALQLQIIATTGAISWIPFNTSVSTFTVTTGAVVVGVPTLVVGRVTTTFSDLWVNGARGTPTAFTGTIQGVASGYTEIGTRSFSAGTAFAGSVISVTRWPFVLSDAQVPKSLRDYWQIFQP